MLVRTGLSSVNNMVQKIDNDDRNVVVDVTENVEVVSVSAVAVGGGGKSKKNR